MYSIIKLSMKKSIIILLLLISFISLTSCKDKTTPVTSTYVDATSYIVMDKTTHRVFEGRNIHQRILPASTTKILTCLTIINNFDLDQYIKITYDMINIEGSRIYLEVDEVISVKDLLYGLMLNSGNDASLALAIGLCNNVDNFVYLMNEECKKIGMKNSTFENPNGLDETSKNYTTAYDMALLMSYALENEDFRTITSCKEYKAKLPTGRTLYFNNKHKLIHTNDLTTGGKTGYTKKAGRTLITSFEKKGFEIIVCTFDATNDWESHTQLAKNTFNSYLLKEVISKYEFNKSTNNKYLIKNEDLLFPLSGEEEVDSLRIEIITSLNYATIYYYQNEKIIGFKKVKNK